MKKQTSRSNYLDRYNPIGKKPKYSRSCPIHEVPLSLATFQSGKIWVFKYQRFWHNGRRYIVTSQSIGKFGKDDYYTITRDDGERRQMTMKQVKEWILGK